MFRTEACCCCVSFSWSPSTWVAFLRLTPQNQVKKPKEHACFPHCLRYLSFAFRFYDLDAISCVVPSFWSSAAHVRLESQQLQVETTTQGSTNQQLNRLDEKYDQLHRRGDIGGNFQIIVADKIACGCTNESFNLHCNAKGITSDHLLDALNGMPISHYCPQLYVMYALVFLLDHDTILIQHC